jgi:hypothetical protein
MIDSYDVSGLGSYPVSGVSAASTQAPTSVSAHTTAINIIQSQPEDLSVLT